MTQPEQSVMFIGLNYPPEISGISPYTGGMASGLVRRGREVAVLTAHPHYPEWKVQSGYGGWRRRETLDDVRITRVRHYVPRRPAGLRRAISELTFGLRVVMRRWNAPEIIICVSPALISTSIATLRARLIHRTTPLVVWVQDLYSLGLSETGQGGRLTRRVVSAIERWVLRTATQVVVIHDRFAERVAGDFAVPVDRIGVVRNWAHLPSVDMTDLKRTRRQLGWGDDELVLLHTGNMGVKQGLETVVEAARIAAGRCIKTRFVLLGNGSERSRLEQLGANVRTLTFMDSLSDEEYVAALRAADILLLNEMPGVAEMAVPSKLTSYFDSGRPVLAATDARGITADELRAANAGVVVEPGNPTALLDAAITLGADRVAQQRLGENGKRYRETVLDEEAALDRFTEILNSLVVAPPDAEPSPERRTA